MPTGPVRNHSDRSGPVPVDSSPSRGVGDSRVAEPQRGFEPHPSPPPAPKGRKPSATENDPRVAEPLRGFGPHPLPPPAPKGRRLSATENYPRVAEPLRGFVGRSSNHPWEQNLGSSEFVSEKTTDGRGLTLRKGWETRENPQLPGPGCVGRYPTIPRPAAASALSGLRVPVPARWAWKAGLVHANQSVITRPPTSVRRKSRPWKRWVRRSWSIPKQWRRVAWKSLMWTGLSSMPQPISSLDP